MSSISGCHIGKWTVAFPPRTPFCVQHLTVDSNFFRNGTPSINIPTDKIVEISEFGNTIFNLSIKYPIVYGLSSIFLALVAGVAVSFIRRQISRWKSERIDKPSMY